MTTPDDHDAFHLSAEQVEAGLASVRQSPLDVGALELIVIRPAVDERIVLPQVEVDAAHGLAGDTWETRGSRATPDGSANPGDQVTVMNSRFARLVAATQDRVPLAGDQLYLDLDLSWANLPTGTRLEFDEVVLEVTDVPHTGCSKFRERFGMPALRATNAPEGKELRLRGINTTVILGGMLRQGEAARVSRP
ncbi:MAG TPA: MOSC domain-containing protein [Actinobacteria bacterium]|nr:MOSC domain-containing protein [Actinomycetota bacterium]